MAKDGRTGRPKKPTALKASQGTDRPDRRNDQEPTPHGLIGDPPDWLDAENEIAIWGQVTEACFYLTGGDRETLGRFCRWTAIWRTAAAKAADDLVNKSGSGTERPSGIIQTMDKAEAHLEKLGSRLGLDPVSRSDIKIGPKSVDSPWKQFKKL